MTRAKRQEFTDDDAAQQPEPAKRRTWECQAHNCPHVGAIRAQGSSLLLCPAHAVTPSQHWEAVTQRLRRYAELLRAVRAACGYPAFDAEDASYAQGLLDLAAVSGVPGVDEAKVMRATAKTRTAAYWVEQALVAKVLDGIDKVKPEDGTEPVRTEVDLMRSNLQHLLAEGARHAEERAAARRAR